VATAVVAGLDDSEVSPGTGGERWGDFPGEGGVVAGEAFVVFVTGEDCPVFVVVTCFKDPVS
jgi:hypothetical protein